MSNILLISEEEIQMAKDILWNLFVTQFVVHWKNAFPRTSSIARYMEPEMLQWLEKVGQEEGDEEEL